MAVVHAPAGSVEQVAKATGGQAAQDGTGSRARERRQRRPRGPMPLPMMGLGVLVIFAVGFGAGEVRQFDKDWRTGTPHVVAQASGTIAPGADLGSSITELLAGDPADVHAVTCGQSDPDPVAVHGNALARVSGAGLIGEELQVCRASSALGMVTIVAAPAGEDVDVTVFAAP